MGRVRMRSRRYYNNFGFSVICRATELFRRLRRVSRRTAGSTFINRAAVGHIVHGRRHEITICRIIMYVLYKENYVLL